MKGAAEAVDVLIVGAGPAGLTAATYLGRFLRRVIVADGGEPRAAWIPVSHNMPGFPVGVTGRDIVARLREQAVEYGAGIEAGRIERLVRDGDGFEALLNGRWIRASAVLLATGVVDRLPDLVGVEQAVRRSLVRICPICDGYEARDKRIAVIGDDDAGVREAAFLRTYSQDVTLIHTGPKQHLKDRGALDRLGVNLVETGVETLRIDADELLVTGYQGLRFDVVYSILGTRPEVALADGLGAARAEDGRLVVDDHGRTSVPGFYAAGDVVRGLNQIAVAAAEAAVASTDIHNHLRAAESLTTG